MLSVHTSLRNTMCIVAATFFLSAAHDIFFFIFFVILSLVFFFISCSSTQKKNTEWDTEKKTFFWKHRCVARLFNILRLLQCLVAHIFLLLLSLQELLDLSKKAINNDLLNYITKFVPWKKNSYSCQRFFHLIYSANTYFGRDASFLFWIATTCENGNNNHEKKINNWTIVIIHRICVVIAVFFKILNYRPHKEEKKRRWNNPTDAWLMVDVFWLETCRITILFNITCHWHDQYYQYLDRSLCVYVCVQHRFSICSPNNKTSDSLKWLRELHNRESTYDVYMITMHLSASITIDLLIIKCFDRNA